MTAQSDLYLLADIGGTNTRVASAENGQLLPETVRRYRNADYDALEAVLEQYRGDIGRAAPRAACLAMAGPVRDGVGHMTNLDWTLGTDMLQAATGAETVALLNDLQAQGHALGHLADGALTTVLPGTPHSPRAAQLVIGVGTGFNAAPVYNTATGRYVPPSECGHASLPVRNQTDLSLAEYVRGDKNHAPTEEVLSGRGLTHVYGWLCNKAGRSSDGDAATIMARAEDGSDPLALDAVTVFVRVLATVAGDLALTHLPFGGIYLIGGVSRAMQPHFDTAGFATAFADKGRFGPFMAQFPVSVINDDNAALTGSAHHLRALLATG